MSALYYSFIIFACFFLLGCAILCIPTVIYASSWLLSEAYAYYLDFKLIQINKKDVLTLPEHENEQY